MRVVLVDAPESLLDERRRRGMDKFDERWEGEWHFVNPAKSWHALLNGDMLRALGPLADRAGLRPTGGRPGCVRGREGLAGARSGVPLA